MGKTKRIGTGAPGPGRPKTRYKTVAVIPPKPDPSSLADPKNSNDSNDNRTGYRESSVFNGALDDEESDSPSGESITSPRSKSIAALRVYRLGGASDDEELWNLHKGRLPPGKFKIGKQKSHLQFDHLTDCAWAYLPEFFDLQVSSSDSIGETSV